MVSKYRDILEPPYGNSPIHTRPGPSSPGPRRLINSPTSRDAPEHPSTGRSQRCTAAVSARGNGVHRHPPCCHRYYQHSCRRRLSNDDVGDNGYQVGTGSSCVVPTWSSLTSSGGPNPCQLHGHQHHHQSFSPLVRGVANGRSAPTYPRFVSGFHLRYLPPRCCSPPTLPPPCAVDQRLPAPTLPPPHVIPSSPCHSSCSTVATKPFPTSLPSTNREDSTEQHPATLKSASLPSPGNWGGGPLWHPLPIMLVICVR